MAQTLYSQQSRAAADRQHRQSGGDTVGAAAVSAGCVAYIFHLPVQGHQDLRQGIPDTHTHKQAYRYTYIIIIFFIVKNIHAA